MPFHESKLFYSLLSNLQLQTGIAAFLRNDVMLGLISGKEPDCSTAYVFYFFISLPNHLSKLTSIFKCLAKETLLRCRRMF